VAAALREDKLRALVGLALRSRRVAMGRGACRRAAKEGRLKLLLVAADAGATALRDAGSGPGIECLQLRQDKYELGEWVGRSALAILGILDPHVAAGLLEANRDRPPGTA
jgi:ribosomal protein L7Ae-like RNA K-turn-binding protein